MSGPGGGGAGGGGSAAKRPRVLGLDYGSARCGCALSDVTGTLASPVEPVLRPGSDAGLRELVALVEREAVGHVVLGLPLSLSGGDSDQTREARRFAEVLGERLTAAGSGVEMELYDERFTTRIAARDAAGGGRGGTSEDSRAAAVLLQGWLDRQARGGANVGVGGNK